MVSITRGALGKADKRKILHISIAELQLSLSATGLNIGLELPKPHQQFEVTWDRIQSSPRTDSLNLTVKDKNIPPELFLADCLCKTEIYEIYRPDTGGLVFFAPRQKPPRVILVDGQYSHGAVIGPFTASGVNSLYPIQYTDIIIYSNRLATRGDLILHASGIALNGKGYCFAGKSGVGKSTLVRNLSYHENVTVLGEDQVILRYLRGRFWIFGTPWHVYPEYCSPMGVPLDTLFFLVKEGRNGVKDVSASDGFKRIMGSAFIPYYQPKLVEGIMKRLEEFTILMPLKELTYEIGADVLKLITSI